MILAAEKNSAISFVITVSFPTSVSYASSRVYTFKVSSRLKSESLKVYLLKCT